MLETRKVIMAVSYGKQGLLCDKYGAHITRITNKGDKNPPKAPCQEIAPCYIVSTWPNLHTFHQKAITQ